MIARDIDTRIVDLRVSLELLSQSRKCQSCSLGSLPDRSFDRDIDEIVVVTGEEIESDSRCEYDESEYQKNYRKKYRQSSHIGMLEKGSQYSLVPLSHPMDHTYSKRSSGLTDANLPFSFEYEEFLVLITRIFDGMRIVDVAFSLSHEEEIEGTIDGECEDQPCREYSEDRHRDEGEEFPENPRECHHGNEYDNRRHDSGDDGDSIFMHCKHDRTRRIISDADLRTCRLYDHDDSIDSNTE